MTAPELSAREREVVERFEAGEAAPESWCCETCAEASDEPDPFAPGTRVRIFEAPGGYLVIPADDLDAAS